MFLDCNSLINLDVSRFKTGNVTSMGHMFDGCSSLTNLDVSGFDTGNVTAMHNMFYRMHSLKSINVSNFNTAKVTRMDGMFAHLYASEGILDLSNFNTSNVINMTQMFEGSSKLTKIDFRNADFSKVTSYNLMFYGVQNNCNITVKNTTSQNWIKGKFPNLTNVNIY